MRVMIGDFCCSQSLLVQTSRRRSVYNIIKMFINLEILLLIVKYMIKNSDLRMQILELDWI